MGREMSASEAAERAGRLREEIRRLRREMSKGGGYILAPAKPLRTETPTENAVAVVEEFLAGQCGSS